jgi:hypothetical protein
MIPYREEVKPEDGTEIYPFMSDFAIWKHKKERKSTENLEHHYMEVHQKLKAFSHLFN